MDIKFISIKAEVRLPMVPNFIRTSSLMYSTVDVADLTDAELEELGIAWTKALIENAQKRRKGN